MSVSPTDLDRLAPELEALTRAAGDIALRFFRGGARSWLKEDSSPVTEADIAVDTFLRQRLPMLLPDCGWLSEETTDAPERLAHERLWIVDPIDGTRSFASGQQDWVISAALVEHGRPVLAALFNPLHDEYFAARTGHGATLNDVAISVSRRAQLRGAAVVGPRPVLENLAETGIVAAPWVHALAYRFALVATGRIDAALSRGRAKDWDIAAVDLILHESGGYLTDLDGGAPRYNRRTATHPPLIAAGHDLSAALVAAAGDAFPHHVRTQEDSV